MVKLVVIEVIKKSRLTSDDVKFDSEQVDQSIVKAWRLMLHPAVAV